ncbi:5'/3'-nucleotidase SurE [Aliiroseovarius crassostreae]|uniref:5'/3'-nucleotidase SurE n=1 Tax=Aliiroseovarius crassostreae TaxID=154981 RepID=UPI002202D066|nr:5'/3'-nucleotidase SurE [Aliiroseovarius crassostreae]UWP90035.1 5'/3'-nucleotidase SurE [Aliiroseovarius crassostreae]UWP93195.1 5'/3'-nucleotidase SurE [Aliiroseovarius crassostreae]
MRILITNDDGINAPGLKVAEAIAKEIAGPDGEVWIVAPAFEQSGVGHCISYTHPFMVAQHGPRRFAAEGSPADCVLAALHHVLPVRPDLVISGVNRGNNSAENALYSGTLGAAMEAALQGLPAIALSQYMGAGTKGLDSVFDAASAHGAKIVRKLLQEAPWDAQENYKIFYNVNFPPVSAENVQGVKAAPQGWRHDATFSAEPHQSPSGRQFLWIKGGPQATPSDPEMDVTENLAGYVSVTPMRADLTAHDHLSRVKDLFS